MKDVFERAVKAQQTWAQYSIEKRARLLGEIAKVLYQNADSLAANISKHNGKVLHEAMNAEVLPTIMAFKFFAGRRAQKALKDQWVPLSLNPVAKSYVRRKPKGVVGLITPWNYPFFLSQADLPAALLAGNSVILKPSEYSDFVGDLILDILKKVKDLPPHLLQVVKGGADVGEALLNSGIKHVSFVGSVAVGQKIFEQASKNFMTCTLELGGKDSALLLPSTNIEKHAHALLWGSFCNRGQTCASIEKIYVHRSQKAKLIEILKAKLDKLPADHFGSMNVPFQEKKVLEMIDQAQQQKAKVVYSRALPGGPPLTLLDELPLESSLWEEEFFGPLVLLYTYDDVQEAIDHMNRSQWGLTCSVWGNEALAEKIAAQINSGVVTLNEHMVTPGFPEAPWSGVKRSGLGVAHSLLSLDKLTTVQYVYSDRSLVRFKFWQYPYTAFKLNFTKKVLKSHLGKTFFTRLLYQLLTLPVLLFKK